MITQLQFVCNRCGRSQWCKIIQAVDLQGGTPAFSPPPRCVVSPAFDKHAEWTLER